MTEWICATCAVEYPSSDEPPAACAICEDERQYVPRSGQAWTSLDQLAAQGHRVKITELEPDLFTVSATPSVGIGQQSMLVRTSAGNLLWDPCGYIDDDGAAAVRALGGAEFVIASHPHMFGVQTAWSKALGGARILVPEVDRHWVQRDDPRIETWTGELEILPGVTVRTIGGHFPGSAVAYWGAGADGRGVALVGDTVYPGTDGKWVKFLRSYPNAIPLSAAVVDRVATALIERPFDRAYGNFANSIEADAPRIIRRSADRYIAWVRGDFDHLT